MKNWERRDFQDFHDFFENFVVNCHEFLAFWRFLVPKFGFYAKFPPQNRLEMSGQLQEPSKTSIFRISKGS